MSDQPPVNVNVNQPEPGFQITIRDLYNEVRGVSTKLDALNTLPSEVADHESRLRTVEAAFVSKASAARWFTAGISIAGVLTALGAYLVHQ